MKKRVLYLTVLFLSLCAGTFLFLGRGKVELVPVLSQCSTNYVTFRFKAAGRPIVLNLPNGMPEYSAEATTFDKVKTAFQNPGLRNSDYVFPREELTFRVYVATNIATLRIAVLYHEHGLCEGLVAGLFNSRMGRLMGDGLRGALAQTASWISGKAVEHSICSPLVVRSANNWLFESWQSAAPHGP